MCRDRRSLRFAVVRDDTMNQSSRNGGAAVERHPHKRDGALAAADDEPFPGVGKRPASQRLQNGFELLCFEDCNRWTTLGMGVKHLNPAQRKKRWQEVGQMYLVHEIGMRSAGEDSGIEGHAKFELKV